MQELLYDEKTKEGFRRLKNHPPSRVFVEKFLPSFHVCFDFGKHHILATPRDYPAATQNKFDEVIRIEFDEVDSPYHPQESEQVVLDNPSIRKVFVLRTVVYFSNEVTYKNRSEAVSRMNEEEKSDPILSKLLSEATGGHEEIVCNPGSDEIATLNTRFTNLVDSGILLETDQGYLTCFSNGNGFNAGGHRWNRSQVVEELMPYYELIEI
jgi:hypothetical protein